MSSVYEFKSYQKLLFKLNADERTDGNTQNECVKQHELYVVQLL